MRRFALALLFALFALSTFGAEEKPTLPSWFPPANGLYKVGALKYYAYNEWDLSIDKTTMKKNSGGYVPVAGKVWRFALDDPKPDAWKSTIERLQKQGFHFVHGDMASAGSSSTLQKGEGDHATYVAFWQCCNAAVIVEPGPNPFHVTLKPPAPTPETFTDKQDIPYVSPIPGSKLVSGRTQTGDTWPQPGCTKDEARGTEKIEREYDAPKGISDYAVLEAYEAAFRAAGWNEVCRTSGHEMDARFTKNGRDIGVYISSQDFHPGYAISVVDTGSGLRAQLKKNCKAALYGVNFDFNKATLRPDSEPALNQVLALLKEEPKLKLEIGGHTDNVGTPAYNMKLSDERAAAVRQWLVAHGIPATRLSSHGYGDTEPVVPNTSDENRAKNRRVEVKRTDCK